MAKHNRIAKNEFRYNYTTKHHNYIFEQDGNDYHSLGITHQRRTKINNKWHKNMPLKQNTQRNKTEKSFIRYGYITQDLNTFGKIDRRFAFSDEDKSKVKAKIRQFKKRRKNKK